MTDTQAITKIDPAVVNEKFKDGALAGEAETMISVATNRGINPHFFCALIALESNYGRSSLSKKNNNFGGIKGGKKYRAFSTKEECLTYMADLLADKYHAKGLVSISKIHSRYAPVWDGNKGWDKKIQRIKIGRAHV